MSANNTVLFVTAGKTDLQLVVKHRQSGKLSRVNVEEKSLRQFHQALLDGKIPYALDDLYAQEAEDRLRVAWDEQNQKLQLSPEHELVSSSSNLVLVPAKLVTIVAELKKPDYCVVACVVFNTCRTNTGKEYYSKEPIACGQVLSRWLADRFNLEFKGHMDRVSNGQAIWLNILDGDMDYSGSDRDFPVTREAIRRVDRIMRQLDGQDLNACLSVGGGIPKFKEQIKACADYRFGRQRVSSWEEPQYQRQLPKLCPPDIDIPTPADSFNFRGHVRDLIRHGDFTGAYSAVCHLKQDSEECRWVQYVQEAADFFHGRPIPKPQLAILQKIVMYQSRCLMAAMRTEAALRGDRITEAISWTCTFFDSALLDFIEKKEGATVDPFSKTVCYPPGKLPSQELLSNGCLTKQGSRNSYEYNLMGEARRQWVSHIDSLDKFDKALHNPHMGAKPQDYRNLNIHAIIKSEYIEKARETFINAKLWANQSGQTGKYFIGVPLARQILENLNIPKPQDLYAQLLEELNQALSNYEIK